MGPSEGFKEFASFLNERHSFGGDEIAVGEEFVDELEGGSVFVALCKHKEMERKERQFVCVRPRLEFRECSVKHLDCISFVVERISLSSRR